jgi:WD40 repeat protein
MTKLYLTIAALFVLPSQQALADFIAVSWSSTPTSEVVSIDPNTGVVTSIGFAGVSGLNSLTVDQSGTLIAATATDYFEIDPTTGGASLVLSRFDTSGGRSNSVRGIAFDSSDVLYTVGNVGSLQRPLLTMDLATGSGTLIGLTGFSGIQALEFSPDGTLYAWDSSDGLLTVNPATGAASAVSAEAPQALIQSIGFTPTGDMFGVAQNQFYRIDPIDGSLTQIGSFISGVSLRGIAYVPEPQTATLLILGLVILSRFRPAA